MVTNLGLSARLAWPKGPAPQQGRGALSACLLCPRAFSSFKVFVAPVVGSRKDSGPLARGGIETVLDPDTEFGHIKGRNVYAGIQLWADTLEEPITELTSKILHTKFNSLEIGRAHV